MHFFKFLYRNIALVQLNILTFQRSLALNKNNLNKII
jgi:hypothetical protein